MTYRPLGQRGRDGFDWPDNPDDPTPEPTAEQQLAAAVMRQALTDAHDAHLPSATRQQAAAFLRGTEGLQFWCSVAGLKPQIVRTLAARALDSRVV